MPSSISLSTLSLLPPRTHKPTIPTFLFSKTKPNSLTIKSSVEKDSKTSSWVSPDWLTSLTRSLTFGKDNSNVPIASAKLEDVSDLLGGALFLPLFKWMNEYGPIYLLAAGPRNFVVVSDAAIAKHVLRNYGTKYAKGLVAEVSEFLFGPRFAIAEGSLWTAMRRAVVPSLHRKYLSVMVDRVFCKCAERLVEKFQYDALNGTPVNMEFEALCKIIPGQIKAEKTVKVNRETVEELVAKCKEIIETEVERIDEEEYVNDADPSILRFLLASREEVSRVLLRDDLLSTLVAGHETLAQCWTLYLLSKWILTTWWADAECKLIMKNCHEALPAGGKLIAWDPMLPEESDDSHRMRALLEGDIFVMTIYRAKGKHRTEEEFRQLGVSAGLPHFRAIYDYFYTLLEFQK